MRLELCIESSEEAKIAGELNISRVELCQALALGGLTPSYGLISRTCEITSSEVHVMIRPRSGNFDYNREEMLLMQRDIIGAKSGGAKGVVFGVLDQNSKIDIQRNLTLAETARKLDLDITFHRAFDLVNKWQDGLETLINLGFTRILTSGSQPKAIDGIQQIKEINTKAAGRIQIMAGSGINATQVDSFKDIGIKDLHFSAQVVSNATSAYGFGNSFQIDTNKIVSIIEKVKK